VKGISAKRAWAEKDSRRTRSTEPPHIAPAPNNAQWFRHGSGCIWKRLCRESAPMVFGRSLPAPVAAGRGMFLRLDFGSDSKARQFGPNGDRAEQSHL